jgi:hypothetical protein
MAAEVSFGELSSERFASEYWTRLWIHIPHAVQQDDLPSFEPTSTVWSTHEQILLALEAQARTPCSRSPVLDSMDFLEGLAQGRTLQLRHLERILPPTHPAVSVARQLAFLVGHPLDSISLFVTPPGGAAIADHHDLTEIFTLQVRGAKRWHFTSSEQPPADISLQAGDLLYVPAGVKHKVACEDTGPSISYAFVYRPITLASVLSALSREAALATTAGAGTLPVLRGAKQLALENDWYRRALDDWQERLSSIDITSLYRKACELALSRRAPPVADMLSVLVDSSIDTPFARTQSRVLADAVDDSVVLSVGGSISVRIPLRAIIEVHAALRSTSVMTARALARHLAAADALRIVRLLARVGLCHIVTTCVEEAPSEDAVVEYTTRFLIQLASAQAASDPEFAERLVHTSRSALGELCGDPAVVAWAAEILRGRRCEKIALDDSPIRDEELKVVVPEEYEQ